MMGIPNVALPNLGYGSNPARADLCWVSQSLCGVGTGMPVRARGAVGTGVRFRATGPGRLGSSAGSLRDGGAQDTGLSPGFSPGRDHTAEGRPSGVTCSDRCQGLLAKPFRATRSAQ